MILGRLSPPPGDRDQSANRSLAARCVAQTALLNEIAAGLTSSELAITADCAGVLATVAETRPALAKYRHSCRGRELGSSPGVTRTAAKRLVREFAPSSR